MSDQPLLPESAYEPSQNDKLMAAFGHGLTFVEGGIVGPLIIYLIQDKKNAFSAFHSLQSLYFGLAFVVITLVTCGLGAVLVIPYMIFEIIATVKAYNGEWYVLPLVGKYALEKHPPPQGVEPTPPW
ncbi:MAG: putative membrane protein [Cognaticolwellia sp.]